MWANSVGHSLVEVQPFRFSLKNPDGWLSQSWPRGWTLLAKRWLFCFSWRRWVEGRDIELVHGCFNQQTEFKCQKSPLFLVLYAAFPLQAPDLPAHLAVKGWKGPAEGRCSWGETTGTKEMEYHYDYTTICNWNRTGTQFGCIGNKWEWIQKNWEQKNGKDVGSHLEM